MNKTTNNIPKRIFIVPYRNRVQHKHFFSKYMTYILEDQNDYEIYFSHQCDARTFNRGAVKNIGFIAVKNKYPDHYKNITFIFNDVDTVPFYKIFNYETTHGTVKHYYGFKHALGGIVVIKGADFEKTNGYPCFWGWGMEDKNLQNRCEALGIKIDRSLFYNIGSPEILQLFDGISRIISTKEHIDGQKDDGVDGLKTISQLKFKIEDKSANPNDNVFIVDNTNIMFINIYNFLTRTTYGDDEYYTYDLREPKNNILTPNKLKQTKQSVVNTTDWGKIPYYPTTLEKKEKIARDIIASGKNVPTELMKQISLEKQKNLKTDHFNNFNNNVNNNVNQLNNTVRHPPNKYSPQYATYIGHKSPAQPSAKIRLGGAY